MQEVSPGQADWLGHQARSGAVTAVLQEMGLVEDVVGLVRQYSKQQHVLLLACSAHSVARYGYDPATNRWTQLSPHQWTCNCPMAMVSCSGQLHVVSKQHIVERNRWAHQTICTDTGAVRDAPIALVTGGYLSVRYGCVARGLVFMIAGPTTPDSFFVSLHPDTGVVQPLARPRAHPASGLPGPLVTYQDSIYVLGGGVHNANGTAFRAETAVERYDVTANEWRHVQPLLTARIGAATVVADDAIIVCGGNTLHMSLRSCERYRDACWTAVADMHTKRHRVTAVFVDRRVVVCGGCAEANISDTAESYDPKSDTWTVVASLGKSFRALAVVAGLV
jgi:hypothetical protein